LILGSSQGSQCQGFVSINPAFSCSHTISSPFLTVDPHWFQFPASEQVLVEESAVVILLDIAIPLTSRVGIAIAVYEAKEGQMGFYQSQLG